MHHKGNLVISDTMKNLLQIFVRVLALSPAYLSACPLVGGLVDYNCDQKHKMAFTGDSITEGIGDRDRNGGWVGDLAAIFPESAISNIGVAGYDSRQLFSAFRKNAPKGKITTRRLRDADILGIEIGTNDYWREWPIKKTYRNIKRLIRYLRDDFYIKQEGATPPLFVVALVPHTRRSFQEPFINQLNSYLRRKRKVLNVQFKFNRLGRRIISRRNQIHPTTKGYEKMAAHAAGQISGVLQTQSLADRPDLDADGVYDCFESKFGTDPVLQDTDSDGLSDGDELFTYNTHPLVADTDSDGASDGDEVAAGTDPLIAETDNEDNNTEDSTENAE